MRNKMKAKVSLRSDLLSRFPKDVRNHMLSFLSAQDLSRYRLVSKDWNEVIGTAEFGKLHAESTKQDAPAIMVVRYLHRYDPGFKTHGWCFLDIKARKWHNVEDDDQMSRHNYWSHGVIAMDKGLFCHFADWEISLDVCEDETETPRNIVVYNPTAKAVKKLPRVPLHCSAQEYPDLSLFVDNVAHSFRVFLINQGFDCTSVDDRVLIHTAPLMHIYDSVSDKWNEVKNPVGIKYGIAHVSSVVFKGLLYVVLTFFDEHGDRSLNPLWTYDLAKDRWDNLPLQVPPEFIPCPALVCTENRLYMVGWSMKLFPVSADNTVTFSANSPWCYEVTEITLGHPLRLVTRFHLLEDLMVSILDVETGSGWDPNDIMKLPPEVKVIPFDDYLMIISLQTGKVVVCNLNSGLFDTQLPKMPNMDEFPKRTRSWFHGKHMNLMLPSTRWP